MSTRRDPLEGVRLAKSPLFFVLAQIRFSAILQMEKFLPAIQDALRPKYPHFRRADYQRLTLVPELRLEQASRWLFLTKSRRTAISLATDNVVLETTDYEAFPKFLQELREAAESIHRVASIALVNRVGLRYLDVVQPKEGETLSDYLSPCLTGFSSGDLKVRDLTFGQQYFCKTDEGTLNVRVFQRDDGQVMPPDIEASDLVARSITTPSMRLTMLDVDHFSERQWDFNPEELTTSFDALHLHCKIAFVAATTEGARNKKWQETSS